MANCVILGTKPSDGQAWLVAWFRQSLDLEAKLSSPWNQVKIIPPGEDCLLGEGYLRALTITDLTIRKGVLTPMKTLFDRPHRSLHVGQYPFHAVDLIHARRSMDNEDSKALFDCLYPELAVLANDEFRSRIVEVVNVDRQRFEQSRTPSSRERAES